MLVQVQFLWCDLFYPSFWCDEIWIGCYSLHARKYKIVLVVMILIFLLHTIIIIAIAVAVWTE